MYSSSRGRLHHVSIPPHNSSPCYFVLVQHTIISVHKMSAFPPAWTFTFDSEVGIDAAVELRQQQIQQLQKDVLLLWSRRNLLSPTCRIPPEVLADIFYALVREWLLGQLSEDEPINAALNAWDWLTVTMVCRHWREVALCTPRLWKYIRSEGRHFDGKDHTTSCFQLSGNTPLTIFRIPDSDYIMTPKLHQGVLQNMRRVRSMSAFLSAHFFQDAAAFGSMHAPILEHLSIRYTRHMRGAPDFEVVKKASWPRLHTLELHGPSFSLLEATLRPSITILTVRDPSGPLTSGCWAHLLRQLRSLQRLQLEDVVSTLASPQNVTVFSDAGSVALPSLKSISITYSHSGVEHGELLDALDLPGDVNVKFNGMYAERDCLSPRVMSAISRSLGNVARRSNGDLSITRSAFALDITVDWQDICTLTAYTDGNLSTGPCGSELWSNTENTAGWTKVISRRQESDTPIPPFCMHHPLSDLKYIRLTSDRWGIWDSEWSALAQLPSVQEITVNESHFRAISALAKHLVDPCSFASLDSLVFSAVKWHVFGDGYDMINDDPRTPATAIFEPLAAALAARRAHGKPLRRLSILFPVNVGERWDHRQEGLNELRKQVEEFEMDPLDMENLDQEAWQDLRRREDECPCGYVPSCLDSDSERGDFDI